MVAGAWIGRPSTTPVPARRMPLRKSRRLIGSSMPWRLGQVIAQRERVLHAVANGRTAIATEALKLSSRGTGDDGIRLLRLAVLEHPDPLQHKGSGLAADSSYHPLEANERGRAVAAIHHQVLNLPFPLDVAGEGLRDAGP